MRNTLGKSQRRNDRAARVIYLLAALALVGFVAGCDGPQCLDGRSIEEDIDEDALPDCFEDGKGDIDGDGEADLIMPVGTSSGQKDIIIRYDWMECESQAQPSCSDEHSHEPDLDALEDVRLAFLNSPVRNPDGSTGIRIHYERGGPIPHQKICDCECIEGIVRDQERLLSPEERASEHAPIIATVKEKLVHYVLFSHQHNNSKSSGVACGSNGFTHVSLGGWPQHRLREAQAGTLMHEIGHQLGLDHGGADGVNYKPNYLSVMNYAFQNSHQRTIGLDYSRIQLPSLDKMALDENLGIGIQASPSTVRCTTSNELPCTRFFWPDLSESGWVTAAGGIDWDGSGTFTTVSQDINGNTICVTPGDDDILETHASSLDRYFDRTAQAFMITESSRSIASTDLRLLHPTNPNLVHVYAGSDRVLDTPRDENDVLHGFIIVAGDDERCDTELHEVEGDDFLTNYGDNQQHLYGYDDWSNLNLAKLFELKGGFGEEIPASLPEINWHEPFTPINVMRSQESDIHVQTIAHFSARDSELSYDITIENLGPHVASEGATVIFYLPETSSNVLCEKISGICQVTTGESHVLILTDPLEVGVKSEYHISLNVDSTLCDDYASYNTHVWTGIPNVEVNHKNDRYDLHFPDEDGDGSPDICIWPVSQLGVYGEAALRIANRAQVRTPDGWGTVAANGLIPLHLDTDTEVGDIFAAQNVFMANRALAHGKMVIGGRLEKQHGAGASGEVQEGAPPSPELPSLLLAIDWPEEIGGSAEVVRGETLHLSPGRYNRIAVFGGGDLYLSPGDYYIDSLQLEAQGRVHIDIPQSEIRIFIRDRLISRAEWLVKPQSESKILLAYDGTEETIFDTSFYGTILAPKSTVRFGSASGLLLNGALLAKNVELRPDVTVVHIPFSGIWPLKKDELGMNEL